eukprot:246718_1
MAALTLFVFILTAISCQSYERNNALIKREKSNQQYSGNEYNHYDAQKNYDYDKLVIEEQEKNDLFNHDNDAQNDENEGNYGSLNHHQPQQRGRRIPPKQEQHDNYDNAPYYHRYGFSAGMMDDDDSMDMSDGDGTYSQKQQLTAFLLSFFLGGFGAGRFYVGDYAIGSTKLVMVYYFLHFVAVHIAVSLVVQQMRHCKEIRMDSQQN